MEIVERGELNRKKRNKFKCVYCGSVLIAKNSELKYVGTQYNESIYEFYCPICECKRTTDDSEIEKVE